MKTITLTIDLSNISTEAEYNQAINNAVAEFSKLDDGFFKSQFVNGLKGLNAGNKGRISVPEFLKKVKPESTGTGKKGRPADSDEVKLQKLEAKAEAAKQAILNKSSDKNEASA